MKQQQTSNAAHYPLPSKVQRNPISALMSSEKLNSTSKGGSLQARRRGCSDPRQLLSVKTQSHPPVPNVVLDTRFENPRKAPVPQGLRFNPRRTLQISPFSSGSSTAVYSDESDAPSTPATVIRSSLLRIWINQVELTSPDLKDIAKVSVFRLPVFDPEKEMAKLRMLWKKKWPEESLSPPLMLPIRPRSDGLLRTRLPEPSFFESDSESEDEEFSLKRSLSFSFSG